MKEKKKRLIVVREDLAEKAMNIARKKGKTLFALTNEIFEEALKAYEIGKDLSGITEYYEFVKAEKEAGIFPVPIEILSKMMETVDNEKMDELRKAWYEWGKWYEKYLSAKFYGMNSLDIMDRMFSIGIWKTSDFSLLKKDGESMLRCILPYPSAQITQLFSNFLKGFLDSSGFEIVREDCSRGILVLEFKEKQSGRSRIQ